MSDKKKNSISLGLKNGNPTEGEVDLKAYEAKVEAGKKAEEVVCPAILASMVDHPITIKYGEDSLRVSGRARLHIADFDKLPSPLPQGLVAKKL